MVFEIREASKADIPEICTVLDGALLRKQSYQDQSWDEGTFSQKEVDELLQNGTVLIAEAGNSIAGTVQYTESDTNMWNGKGADNTAFYIHRLARSTALSEVRGVGEELISAIAKRAQAVGRAYLRLDCPASNQSLCSYYEGLGFTQVALSEEGRVAYYQKPLV